MLVVDLHFDDAVPLFLAGVQAELPEILAITELWEKLLLHRGF